MDAAPEQGLAGVDVAYADNGMAVHDETLDGLCSVPGQVIQVRGAEILAQRFGAQVMQQGVFKRVPVGPVDGTETPRIAQSQAGVITEYDIDVVVFVGRDRRVNDTQAAGHAKVQDDATVLQVKQQVFRAPPHSRDPAADEFLLQNRRDRPAQLLLPKCNGKNGFVEDVGRNAPTSGFNLG